MKTKQIVYWIVGSCITVTIVFFLLFLLLLNSICFVPQPEPPLRTRAKLKLLHQAVNLFKLDTGRYPTAEEGLTALVLEPANIENWQPGGYIEGMEVPKDGWEHPFIYLRNPNSRTPFVIISYGADGKEGGQGDDTDLYSTDLR